MKTITRYEPVIVLARNGWHIVPVQARQSDYATEAAAKSVLRRALRDQQHASFGGGIITRSYVRKVERRVFK